MIRLEQVSKAFKGQIVLDHLDLEIEKGKITVIIGQSGGGKSVLLKHMIGLIRPDSGHIYVNGIDIVSLDDKKLNDIRKKFGMLFQAAALFDSMNVGENVAFPLIEHTRLPRKEIMKIAEEKLLRVGLKNVSHKMPSELSGGMRKRVGLARAIALDPEIILFDEPTTGLDPVMCDAIDRLIVETQKQTEATCVIISHDIPSTFKIANKIAMLYQGKIIEMGTPDEVRSSTNPVVQHFIEGKST
ncbi:MAG: ABC transporter ATP-binding protein [Desulfobacterales bacterium]|jgi:phospholipid/cholesterol/gamma-HCH transport system ATP-binding protein|nr:ABC transporter ATP-binding protein [Desulfobacterales bacterium]MDD3081829.1 ABC transporter ATP-binding protein [Desulfobacterales bacterium]MDD3950792.1 ABC transporter ATP-binding protein [Desulfobacterales bacterium]MDD4463073.1 ABC transporter ATP-binding protein [Desulfobacterales bacterium]MDY0376824.1 ABC transporter ATP-binding protein [Desulfobacterales bacterium]